MKFTLWERNSLSDALGGVQMSVVSELEKVLELRKKFRIPDSEKADWNRYCRLCAVEVRSESQQEFFEGYHKAVHSEEVEIKLTKPEFKYVADTLLGNNARLPATEELIEYSIAFHKKLKRKQTETEEV